MFLWNIKGLSEKFIYANDLTELREKEQKLQRDQLDGLDLYAAGIMSEYFLMFIVMVRKCILRMSRNVCGVLII